MQGQGPIFEKLGKTSSTSASSNLFSKNRQHFFSVSGMELRALHVRWELLHQAVHTIHTSLSLTEYMKSVDGWS